MSAGVVLLLGAGSLAGCASIPNPARDGELRVVASTNVYGDIAEQIGGGRVHVQSIIDDSAQDPHSYEADGRTQLALARADVVIENGGGYDDFMGSLLAASGNHPTILNAVEISGRTASNGKLNEHVWYDLVAMRRLALRIAGALGAVEPSARKDFAANAVRFVAGLTRLGTTAAAIAAGHPGTPVAITEPVPLYLLASCGFVNRTPAAFSEAVEEGVDVSVAVLNQTLNLFRRRAVALLVYNEQTSGGATDQVLAAARANRIPIVAVSETLPAGVHYLGWVARTLQEVRDAVA
ncbi:MAG: zinc ABC transporter substrate-binding protein [Jatrophihabitans sp.]